MDELRVAIESVFRRESGRILASLIRVSGSFDLAEDALQDAFKSALEHWQNGIPTNPGAWIITAAQRKLIDYARRERTRYAYSSQVSYELANHRAEQEPAPTPLASAYPDDRLRLIFTCCHPALSQEAQVALTLRTLGGLTTPEIARAFLVPETTLAQRIVRAKAKIRDARIPYEVPAPHVLPERLKSVLAVVYLIFNEAYGALAGDTLVRQDLAADALLLGRLLHELLPAEPEVLGLLALMLLHHARRNARVNQRGQLVPLEEQDRTLWVQDEIKEGIELLDQALIGKAPGPYQVQAAIAACHAHAASAQDTDWHEIAALYGRLLGMTPTVVVALNHAVAIAMCRGAEHGLALIDQLSLSPTLDPYYLLHAARADLLRRVGRHDQARAAYHKALALATNPFEQAYLKRRADELA